jgi:hypothetical protein
VANDGECQVSRHTLGDIEMIHSIEVKDHRGNERLY